MAKTHLSKLLICTLLLFSFKSFSQTEYKSGSAEVEMKQKVVHFNKSINSYLKDVSNTALLKQFMMSDNDIEYWFDQFIFTEEVKAQISEEEFWNKLKSWAVSAENNFTIAIKSADKIEIGSTSYQFGEDPNMRVNKSAEVVLYIIKNKSITKEMKLTLIDVNGNLKIIQAL